ncbi:MAG TPA: carboxypeptidase regulatory-like domain-containing protein [Granulicella sp.]
MPAIRTLLRSLTVLALTLPVAAFAADSITGVVTNRTNNRPAAGDDVVLIRLQQGMQESTRTKTDAHGHFTLEVPDEGIHLVRVTHDKANYFRPAPPGTQSVEIDVYNAAVKVKGVASEADVMRIQTDAGGNGLRVVENFFVKNDSTPPMTQFSNEPFDFWLPEGAIVEGSAALAPGGMPVQAAPVPLTEKNHYTFLFPIRPGETRFQVTYRLPYSGKFAFTPHPSMTTDTVAIMLPKSMTFTQAPNTPYTSVTDEVNAQTFVARNVSPQQPMGFTLSGSGQLPRDEGAPDQGGSQQAQSQGQPQTQGGDSGQAIPETENKMPGRGLQNPLDPEGTRDPWAKYKWWILGGIAVLLAAAAGIMLRKPSGTAAAPIAAGPQPSGPSVPATPQSTDALLLQSLKEELFALETDRLQNRVSESDYEQQRAAIELVLRRALNRTPSGTSVSL